MNNSSSSSSSSSSLPSSSLKKLVAVVQLCSTSNVEENYKTVSYVIKEICENYSGKVSMIFLPEAFAFVGDGVITSYDIAEESLESPSKNGLLSKYLNLAKQYRVWLSLGGFPIKCDSSNNKNSKKKTFNTHILVNSDGIIVESYKKIHLFDANLPNASLKESKETEPGNTIVSSDTPIGRMGLTICYDARFPELYTTLRRHHKCQIMAVPAAFILSTGHAHWHTLLQTRAIENQCYVIAAAQIGMHSSITQRTSYGHALVIDPWGTIIAETSPKQIPSYCLAEIDSEVINRIRKEMPIQSHERCDIYNTTKPHSSSSPSSLSPPPSSSSHLKSKI